MRKYLIAAATILLILLLSAIDAAFTARAILYSYQSEIAALKQQQDANQRDIQYLIDQTFYLRELMRENENGIVV